jgi:hypothetical protein
MRYFQRMTKVPSRPEVVLPHLEQGKLCLGSRVWAAPLEPYALSVEHVPASSFEVRTLWSSAAVGSDWLEYPVVLIAAA